MTYQLRTLPGGRCEIVTVCCTFDDEQQARDILALLVAVERNPCWFAPEVVLTLGPLDVWELGEACGVGEPTSARKVST